MRCTLSFQHCLVFGLVFTGTLMHHETTARPHSLSLPNDAGKQSLVRRNLGLAASQTILKLKNSVKQVSSRIRGAPAGSSAATNGGSQAAARGGSTAATNGGSQAAAQGGSTAAVGSTKAVAQNGAQTGSRAGITGGDLAVVAGGAAGAGAVGGYAVGHH